MADFAYVGSELDLFAAARNWKAYWSSLVRPYVKGEVLETGAGIGSNTRLLDIGATRRWVCLEPDAQLLEQLRVNVGRRPFSPGYEFVCGTTHTLDPSWRFDCIIYIDVLEHIEDDRQELVTAASHLRPGGSIVVLSPAHNWLYAPFDRSIGHFRRYDRPSMKRISPPGLRLERVMYLDCLGLLASAANRYLLRQAMPTAGQLAIWDRYLVPASKILDKVLLHSLGKSILAVWTKPA
ncbi:MAG: methyltransferase domain-containing protein [Acidobacteriaceae bacterium]|nr:methyltransferase domain-containing protein [Acidobacteriaceae bacterium]